MKALITIVGTSVLTNYIRQHSTIKKADCTSDLLLQHVLDLPDPRLASAELNSNACIEMPANVMLHLICSDHPDCLLCGRVLQGFYEQQGRVVQIETIRNLSHDYTNFMEHGLKNLIKNMADLIEQYDQDVAINATGGFKAECAVATMLGMLYGLDVYYMHEDFKSIITFPRLPVGFNFELYLAHSKQIEAVLAATGPKEAQDIRKHLPASLQMLFARDSAGKRYILTAFGEAIKRAALAQREAGGSLPIGTGVRNTHTSLFGDGIESIRDIKNADIRQLLERIEHNTRPYVSAIKLGSFCPSDKSNELYFKFMEKEPGKVSYQLCSPAGSEYVELMVAVGHEGTVIKLLGKKIYL